MLTQKHVKSVLDYDKDTGVFRWKITRGRAKAGKIAGWIGAHGYRYIKVDQTETTAARLAWLYVTGRLPKQNIEHLNGDRTDCRLQNLTVSSPVKLPLTAERLRQLIRYDQVSGIFARARGRAKLCGRLNDQGYVLISVDAHYYRAHRLAWLYIYGQWPCSHIDHINGNPSDNRLSNLREATASQNLANARTPVTNKSGYKGVSWHAGAKKWQAHIRAQDGKSVYLGLFASPAKAHDAYCSAAVLYRGSFARMA